MNKFVYVVSAGFERVGTAVRGISFASKAAAKGHHVEVFLLDDAVIWAQLGMGEWVYAVTGEHMKDLLDVLIENKTPIHVCQACADKRLIPVDECIEGAKMSSSAVLADMMTDAEVKVFIF
jgi:uncharacterized protein involved in oxidation of intracellular sulfur